MVPFTRPVSRSYGRWHPHVSATPACGRPAGGGALALAGLYGPAGLVGPAGSADHPYCGMDPSDPVTWVRPYNPAPGMIAQLNFDGAGPNTTQTTGGGRRRRHP
jgi:hypothetical protein